MFYLLLVTFGTVLLCEWLGDKNLYTITSLTMRFRSLYIFCGFTAAYMIKMGVAVLAGQAIAMLPTSFLRITSTLTFFVAALFIWFRRTDTKAAASSQNAGNFSRVSLLAFGTILLSEWGDVGQIMAATLTVRYKLPFMVWVGATLALVTKGILALAIGRGLKDRLPVSVLRPVCACVCVVMGIVSALQLVFSR